MKRGICILALVLVCACGMSMAAWAQATYVSGMRVGASGMQIRTGNVTFQDSSGTTHATITSSTGAAAFGALSYKSNVIYNTDASETLATTQSGYTVIATAAGGATTVTLPTASASTVGVVYNLIQTADQDLVITTAVADNNSFVADGVATSDQVSLATAGHKIGAGAIVIGIQTGAATYKWWVGGLNPACPLTVEAAD